MHRCTRTNRIEQRRSTNSGDGTTVVTEMEQQSILGTESESGDSGLLLTNHREGESYEVDLDKEEEEREICAKFRWVVVEGEVLTTKKERAVKSCEEITRGRG